MRLKNVRSEYKKHRLHAPHRALQTVIQKCLSILLEPVLSLILIPSIAHIDNFPFTSNNDVCTFLKELFVNENRKVLLQ